MNNLILIDESDYLAHYGVPGMKWGHRKLRRMYKSSGFNKGRADYYKERSQTISNKYNRYADAISKKASAYEKKGSYIKAELARSASEKIKQRGINASAESKANAEKYLKKSVKTKEKAAAYATKKRVSLGESEIKKLFEAERAKGKSRTAEYEKSNDVDNVSTRYGSTIGNLYSKFR